MLTPLVEMQAGESATGVHRGTAEAPTADQDSGTGGGFASPLEQRESPPAIFSLATSGNQEGPKPGATVHNDAETHLIIIGYLCLGQC